MYTSVHTASEKVTIGLYSTERDGWESALKQIANIKKIYIGIRQAANDCGRVPPQFVLSAYLIPSWAEGKGDGENSRFEDSAYREKQKQFLNALQAELDRESISVVLENFCEEIEKCSIERNYLIDLTARGSNADMIKTHALIKAENQDYKHLQIDSNTQILSYQKLYDATFRNLSAPLETGVMLNASCYASDYVAGMNKIVYTRPNSVFVQELSRVHLSYCEAYSGEPRTSREKTKANSIYSKDFTVALETVGLVKAVRKGEYSVFPVVNMMRPELGITPLMITAKHQSWKDPSTIILLGSDHPLVLLEQIWKDIIVELNDAVCDSHCFQTLLQKYTDPLSLQEPEDGGVHLHKALLRISNEKAECHLMRAYFIKLAERLANNQVLSPDTRLNVIREVVAKIPDTPLGNELTQSLFRCTVLALKDKPFELMKWSLIKQCASNPVTRDYIRQKELVAIPEEFGNDLGMVADIDRRAGQLFSEKGTRGKPVYSVIQEAALEIISKRELEQSLKSPQIDSPQASSEAYRPL